MRYLTTRQMQIVMESTPRVARPYVKALLGTDVTRGYEHFISVVDAKLKAHPLPDERAVFPLFQGISWMLTTDADKLDAESMNGNAAQLVMPFLKESANGYR